MKVTRTDWSTEGGRTESTYEQDAERANELIRGYLYTIAELKLENEYLKKKLSEADRTSTFYRYHKGGKS